MPASVEETSLKTEEGPDGVEYLAFGEFVSRDGELASYALSWVTGPHQREAFMTVGIGGGNEGAGTFHCRIFEEGGGCVFQLVDEPLAEVPQGGPHLSVAEALEHEDLRFIWSVASYVLDNDRRGLWVRHRIEGTSCLVAEPVLAGTQDVLEVAHYLRRVTRRAATGCSRARTTSTMAPPPTRTSSTRSTATRR